MDGITIVKNKLREQNFLYCDGDPQKALDAWAKLSVVKFGRLYNKSIAMSGVSAADFDAAFLEVFGVTKKDLNKIQRGSVK